MGKFTVFSASNYAGSDNNFGSVLTLIPNFSNPSEWEQIPSKFAVLPAAERAVGKKKDGHECDQTDAPDGLRAFKWHHVSKMECFRILKTLIFTRRHKLLYEFQRMDPGLTGTLPLLDWVQICQWWLHPGLAWIALSKYLTIKHNRQVVHVPFLDRFQNNLVQRSMMEWVNAVRPYLTTRLVRSPRAKNGAFNLYDLFEPMRDELHAIDLTAAYYFLKCNDSAKHPCTVTIKGLRNRTRGVEAKADGAVDL